MHTVQLHYSVHDAGSSFQEAHRVIGSWCRIARVFQLSHRYFTPLTVVKRKSVHDR